LNDGRTANHATLTTRFREWRVNLEKEPALTRQILQARARRVCDEARRTARRRRDGDGDIRAAPVGAARCSGVGAPGVTRTPGTQFRKLLLYPPELRGHAPRPRSDLFYPAVVDGHSLATFEAPTGRADVLMPHGEKSRPGAAARRGFRPVRPFRFSLLPGFTRTDRTHPSPARPAVRAACGGRRPRSGGRARG
jgi:hypothetical protein